MVVSAGVWVRVLRAGVWLVLQAGASGVVQAELGGGEEQGGGQVHGLVTGKCVHGQAFQRAGHGNALGGVGLVSGFAQSSRKPSDVRWGDMRGGEARGTAVERHGTPRGACFEHAGYRGPSPRLGGS